MSDALFVIVCFLAAFAGVIAAQVSLAVLLWACAWATPDIRRPRRFHDSALWGGRMTVKR